MRSVLLAVLAFGLSACAGTPWQQAGKTAAQTDTDLRACEQRAERDTLSDRGTNRADYGLATRGPNATMDPRALSPLEMKDQTDMANQFDRLVGRCMKSKGYVQGKSANSPRR